MPRLKRIARLSLAIIVTLPLLGVGGAYLYWRGSLPAVSGRLAAPGLQAPVEVIRDRWGIPHVYARDEGDLFFAQGYVQAQDRLWQMELYRRAARGALAEVLGESALGSDRLARTLGFARQVQADWATLDPDVQQALEAYARGVNACLSAPGHRLPIEFALLGYAPAPWQPQDSLACARLLAWSQDASWQAEALRARLVRAVGPQRAAQLELAGSEPVAVPGELADLSALGQRLLMEEAGKEWPWFSQAGTGGSCWAVDGSRSASGLPILAGGPDMPVQIPSLWYEMHLSGGPYDVIGASIPGLPGVAIGRNRTIAWSTAGAAADTQDLYVERVRAGSALQVERAGQWEEAQVSAELIQVRGRADPVRLRVWITRHGPLVSSPAPGLGEQVALRWAGSEEPPALARCLLAVNRASNWQEFQAALRGWTVPVQAFVYADTGGNTGYLLAGTVPVRTHGDGSFPVPGWTGGYEWNGFAPLQALPAALNPPAHAIVCAGSPATSDGYPGAQPGPAEPYRAERIAALLSSQARLSRDNAQAILDDLRGPEQPILSRLLALPVQGWVQERTRPYLQGWDLRYDAESAGAGVFEAFYWRLAHNTLDDELGPDLVDAYLESPNQRAFMEELSSQPDSPWFDDTRTPAREGRDEIMARSYAEALDWLGRRFGDLPYEWNWGRVHNITFSHALGGRWPQSLLLNRGAMRLGGGPLCVNATASDYSGRLAVRSAPGYRLIVDLGDGRQALAANSTGQSGNPFSPHYADMIDPWRAGRYHPLLFARQAILEAREGTLTLVPGG